MKNLAVIILFLAASFSSYAQFDEDQLLEYSNQIQRIEAKFDERERLLHENMETLNTQLETINKDNISVETLVKRMEALEGKQKGFEQLTAQQKNKEVELTQVRYEAGKLVVKDMIEFLYTIKSQYSGLDFQQSYMNLANPNVYPSYKANVDYMKKKLVKKGLTLPDVDMQNVMLNAVYAITRSMVSIQDNKNDKTKELICILDFTSKASSDLRIVNYDLQYLTSELDKMILNFEDLFRSYTKVVGYNRGFQDYIVDVNDKLDTDLIPNYFEVLKKANDRELERQLKDLKFNLKKVIDAYQEYEIFIRQGLAYYEKFENIMLNISPTCTGSPVVSEVTKQYDLMKSKLAKAKSDFENAYKGKIKQSYIKQLIEG